MAESFKIIISNLDPLTVAFLVVGIVAILAMVPKIINDAGIKKIGPIQIEQENQTLNFLTNKRIEEIDIENRENLWEATEDYIALCAINSKIACYYTVNSILAALSSPIKTMVLLNHIAPKLVAQNETQLIEKLSRSVTKSIRELKNTVHPEGCPTVSDTVNLSAENYAKFFPAWIKIARDITVKACYEKVQVYNEALSQTKDSHWIKIFKSCRDKNIAYIEGMGYIINKYNILEKA